MTRGSSSNTGLTELQQRMVSQIVGQAIAAAMPRPLQQQQHNPAIDSQLADMSRKIAYEAKKGRRLEKLTRVNAMVAATLWRVPFLIRSYIEYATRALQSTNTAEDIEEVISLLATSTDANVAGHRALLVDIAASVRKQAVIAEFLARVILWLDAIHDPKDISRECRDRILAACRLWVEEDGAWDEAFVKALDARAQGLIKEAQVQCTNACMLAAANPNKRRATQQPSNAAATGRTGNGRGGRGAASANNRRQNTTAVLGNADQDSTADE